jgi:hypothetical protein
VPRDDDRKKFVILAEKRVTRALRDLRLIGNLSNRSNYRYTDEDARKICKVLRDAVEEVRARFERRGDDRSVTFKLD